VKLAPSLEQNPRQYTNAGIGGVRRRSAVHSTDDSQRRCLGRNTCCLGATTTAQGAPHEGEQDEPQRIAEQA
jgi:hypothetical protein